MASIKLSSGRIINKGEDTEHNPLIQRLIGRTQNSGLLKCLLSLFACTSPSPSLHNSPIAKSLVGSWEVAHNSAHLPWIQPKFLDSPQFHSTRPPLKPTLPSISYVRPPSPIASLVPWYLILCGMSQRSCQGRRSS